MAQQLSPAGLSVHHLPLHPCAHPAGAAHGIEFMGLRMGQNQNAMVAFDALFKHMDGPDRIQRIVELGTWAGGLSVLFQLYAITTNAEFVTFDLVDARSPGSRVIFDRLRTDFRTVDLCGDDLSEVETLVRRPGVTLLLLDAPSGAEAKRELLSHCMAMMKRYDLVAVHDYAPTREYFDQEMKGRVFDYHEFDDAAIRDCAGETLMQPILPEVMLAAAWFCGRIP